MASLFIISLSTYTLLEAASHLGESCFLGDQLDVILHLFHLAQGEWNLVYGVVFSGTSPPVYSLGSVPNLLFGIPTLLGADPNEMQLLHMVLFVLAGVPLFYKIRNHDKSMAYIFAALLAASPMYWWALTMLWINIFQLPFALLFLAGLIHYYEQPGLNRLLSATCSWLLAIQVHSAPVMAAPLVLIMMLHYFWLAIHRKASNHVGLPVAILTLIVVAPYCVAEFLGDFTNTQAIVAYFAQHGDGSSRQQGLASGTQALGNVFAFMGIRDIELGKLFSSEVFANGRLALATVFTCWMIGLGTLALYRAATRRPQVMDFIWLGVPLCFAAQYFFFVAVDRPIHGPQYVLFSLSLVIFAWAGFLSQCLRPILKDREVLALISSILIIILLDSQKLKLQERSDWNFDNVHGAVSEICAITPRFRSLSQGPFRGYQPHYPDLFAYTADTYIEGCAADSTSDYAVLAERHAPVPDSLELDGAEWIKIRAFKPHIGIYLRQADATRQ